MSEEIEVDAKTMLIAAKVEFSAGIFSIVDGNRDYLSEYMAWVPFVRTEADVMQFLAASRVDHDGGKSKTYIIVESGTPIGTLSFNSIDWGNGTAYIGYWLDPARQGRGVVGRALRKLISAQGEKLHRFVIKCAVENTRSNRLAIASGFSHEGVLRKAEKLNGRFMDQNIYAFIGCAAA